MSQSRPAIEPFAELLQKVEQSVGDRGVLARLIAAIFRMLLEQFRRIAERLPAEPEAEPADEDIPVRPGAGKARPRRRATSPRIKSVRRRRRPAIAADCGWVWVRTGTGGRRPDGGLHRRPGAAPRRPRSLHDPPVAKTA